MIQGTNEEGSYHEARAEEELLRAELAADANAMRLHCELARLHGARRRLVTRLMRRDARRPHVVRCDKEG